MNKQEKNIVDILTFDEIEDIVDLIIRYNNVRLYRPEYKNR